MKRIEIPITLGDAGAGTATAGRTFWGSVHEVRYPGTAVLVNSGTITITRTADGGTIFGGTVSGGTATGPFQYVPTQAAHTTAGAAVTYDGTNAVTAPIPLDSDVQVVVAGGGSAISGTVHLYVG